MHCRAEFLQPSSIFPNHKEPFLDRSKSLLKSFETIEILIFFSQVEKYSINQKHNFEFFGSILIVLGHQFLSIAVLIINANLLIIFDITNAIPLGNFYYFLTYNFSQFYGISSILILIAALRRIRSINKILKLNMESKTEAQKRQNEVLIYFQKFSDTVNLINECFWFIFMLRLFEILFHLIFLSFSVYNIIFNDSSLPVVMFFCSGCIYSLVKGVFVMMIIVFSSFIKRECLNFNNLLLDAENESFETFYNFKSNPVSTLQVEERNISICCGLFEIDWNFLFLMIASSFSSTIILIQFDIADSFKRK